MRRVYITVFSTCLAALAVFFGWYYLSGAAAPRQALNVGFIYDNDESTPYTYNFSLARDALEKKYGSEVVIHTRSNVAENAAEEPVRELVSRGCTLIFLNGYSQQIISLAGEFPKVQFCQVSYRDMAGVSVPANYHTFKGEIYQGRYVTGIAAGMKLRELIDGGAITPEEALVGFVAAFSTPEVISGYTAFLLGVRSVVPEAVMRVRYTGAWSSYSLEKAAAAALIEEGCLVLSQHTDTIGPAIACEEALPAHRVFYVAYNQSTLEVAPSVSLLATRINWTPYVLAAADAVMRGRPIEKTVPGRVHGQDMSAGFDQGWVELLSLNDQLAAEGTRAALTAAIERLKRGRAGEVFRGEYTGTSPDDPADTIDLRGGFAENAASSYPSFHYVLDGVITVEQQP